MERFLETEADTIEAGKQFAADLTRGDLVLLFGDLGAGKTTFVRGVLRGMGWNGPVKSPTFSLIHEYETSPRVAHADLYRLSSVQGTEIESMIGETICLVEWPDRLGELAMLATWHVSLEYEAEGRKLTIMWREPEASYTR